MKRETGEFEKIREMIKDADMVVVGIGEDFEEKDYLMQNTNYQKACEMIATAGVEWVMPYVNHIFLEEDELLKRAYESLASLLEKKNYFIVSVCMNGFLAGAGLREDRSVEPCGSYLHMQCQNGCKSSVVPVEEALLQEVRLCCMGKKAWTELQQPSCKCGGPMVFNSLYAEHYLEEGYQDQWSIYTKWLQGTVNRKLCVLELGAGMMFAGVLRFRFEKIVNLNQKSKIIRVHKNLYQLPEEIAERGIGISQNAVEFMAEMKELC